MPTIDHTQVTPTRDMQAMTVGERQYREEPFQFNAQRLPVSLKRRTRPATSKPRSPEIPWGKANIFIRNSNVSPVESGEGQTGTTWRVNDPAAMAAHQRSGALPGMGAEEDPGTHPTDTRGWSMGKLVGVGLILGLSAYLLKKQMG